MPEPSLSFQRPTCPVCSARSKQQELLTLQGAVWKEGAPELCLLAFQILQGW